MITERKIYLYDNYDGFLEGYVFKNGNLPNEDFELMDWSTIDELIGNFILLKNANISEQFRKQLQDFIQKETENEKVIKYLGNLVERKLKNSSSF